MFAKRKMTMRNLGGGQPLTLDGAKAVTIRCTGGSVWATSGDGRELSLTQGKQGGFSRPARVAILGMPVGDVEVDWN